MLTRPHLAPWLFLLLSLLATQSVHGATLPEEIDVHDEALTSTSLRPTHSSSTQTGITILTGTVKLPPGTSYRPSPTTRMSSNSSGGGVGSTTLSTTGGVTMPTGAQVCNGYEELCGRGYGNVTYVGAHNSPFVREKNIAANQNLEVEAQLEDGIRMLQGQTKMMNDTLHFCHSSCDLLNTGTVEDYLTTVVSWLHRNPSEVITILLGNGDWVDPSVFIPPLQYSGLLDMVYTPPNSASGALIPYNAWPTLGELITSNRRVILFIDYKGDQGRFPMMLREFNHMWETKFSPTDAGFPCGIDRPPGQQEVGEGGKMYIMNHNLNVRLDVFGKEVFIPDKINIERTNSAGRGYGSLGGHVDRCTAQWGRPPTFLLVDFYDVGQGSVFEVAAKANGVPYKNTCCSKKEKDKKSMGVSTFGERKRGGVGMLGMFTVLLAGLVVAGGMGLGL